MVASSEKDGRGDTLQRQLAAIGMCMRAGRLLVGPDVVCDGMRVAQFKKGKKVFLVAEASDTSENTHKKLTDKCGYYGVPHLRLDADMSTLSAAVGKLRAVAAVAITDENFYKLFCAASDGQER